MSPIYCDECGRANGASAKRCIWCGVPTSIGSSGGTIETTRVEIGYLDGIARFEDAGPVRLIISVEGIEVAELIPGTRSVKIPTSSILEANVVDASTMIEGKRVRPTWWWLALGPGALLIPGRKTPDVKEHDYIFTIKYTAGNEIRNAVFHREDRAGLAIVEGLARIVTSIVRHR
ncbi:MAG TPA: hypothetical protein VI837_01710 [Blastocatellia bacterium]|nr:hypothetical protein [Blastocatellia bacterium]